VYIVEFHVKAKDVLLTAKGLHKRLRLHPFPSPLQVIIAQSLITFIAIEKCEKECNMLEIILVQGFCPPKIKISQFPSEC